MLELELPKLSHDPADIHIHSSHHSYLYLRRLENINYETILEEKRFQLEDRLKHHKEEINKLFSHLGNTKKECENLDIDVEFLANYHKYSGLDNKYNKKKTDISYDKMMMMKKYIDVTILLINFFLMLDGN